MPNAKGGLTKAQMNKFSSLMAQFGGVEEKEIEEVAKVALQNAEQMAYEMQAAINFFESRIQPVLDRQSGESETAFTARQDKAYHEWRFKTCKGCEERFAYAYNYDGVAFCSLDCLEKDLARIGIRFSRHKDLKRRWGVTHPAVVSSSALQALSDTYCDVSPSSFET
jgi:hypothetical protein